MRFIVPPTLVCVVGIGLATAATRIEETVPPVEMTAPPAQVEQPGKTTVATPPAVQTPKAVQKSLPAAPKKVSYDMSCTTPLPVINPGEWFDSTHLDAVSGQFVLNRNACGQVVRVPTVLSDATPEAAFFVDIVDDRTTVTSEAGARCDIGLRDALRSLEKQAAKAAGSKRQELYAKAESLRAKSGGEKAWRRAKKLVPAVKNPDPQNCFYKPHGGLDGKCSVGDPVYSPYPGTVMEVGERGGCGKYVKIALKPSGDYLVEFCHSSRIEDGIRPGIEVHKGQTVARCGRTGLPPAQGSHAHEILLSRTEPASCPVIGQSESKGPYQGWYILDPSCLKYIFRVKPKLTELARL